MKPSRLEEERKALNEIQDHIDQDVLMDVIRRRKGLEGFKKVLQQQERKQSHVPRAK